MRGAPVYTIVCTRCHSGWQSDTPDSWCSCSPCRCRVPDEAPRGVCAEKGTLRGAYLEVPL